jgi:uncharacterized protein (TIGR02588 family)
MATRNKKSEQEQKERRGPSALEWASAMVGALLAVLILVFIGAEAIRSSSGEPPLLFVEPVGIVAKDGLHVVEVKVTNRGGQTAAAVQIQGELKQAGSTVETSSGTVGFVPADSEREAGLMFSRDPRQFRLEVRATGFETP